MQMSRASRYEISVRWRGGSSGFGLCPAGRQPYKGGDRDDQRKQVHNETFPTWRGDYAALLALVLFVLLFVAWPLVDVGLLMRPLPGMVSLIVTLSGLYAFGAHGRVLTLVLALGGIVFVSQTLTLVWPLDVATIIAEVAAELFVLSFVEYC